jgi:hypothetical protein
MQFYETNPSCCLRDFVGGRATFVSPCCVRATILLEALF